MEGRGKEDVIAGTAFDVSDGMQMAVWRDGRVDPRLLASLAALWHVKYFGRGECRKSGSASATFFALHHGLLFI